MFLWLPPPLAFVFLVVCCPLGLRGTAIIPSNDPTIIYQGAWEAVNVNGTSYVVSNTTGSKAFYSFKGTRISVFGVILPRDSSRAAQVSEYSVDGATSKQYTDPGNATGPMYDMQFYQSNQLQDGQHTLTILNLGDEFIVGHFEVATVDETHFGSTSSNTNAVATTSQRPSTTSTPSSTFTTFVSSSTAQLLPTNSTANNGILTSMNSTSTVSSTLPPTNTTPPTSSPFILPTSSTSPPDSTPPQNHATTLSKGATIGGGIAGTLGFLFLVGGLCWLGQRRGRRKRQASSVAYNPRPPLGVHTVTSQVTLGSDPFASDPARLHRVPPIYIPVGSTSDLSVGGPQYTPTRGYLNEKYGMDDVPLHSPTSTSNLLGSPTHHAFPSLAPRLETPVEVRRMDLNERRRSADGGVRIAGGRPGQRTEETDDSFLDLASRKSTGSTLPPAYDFD